MMPRNRFAMIVACLCASSVAAAQDASLDDLLIDGQNWQLVAEGMTFSEGPAADAKGNVYFTDTFGGRIHRTIAGGKAEVFVDPSGGCNGLMFGPDGRLYGCQNGKKQIVAFDSAGKATPIAEGVNSNDLVVLGSGAIYFTDPGHDQVWYISPEGEKRVVDRGLEYPNGLILSPDQQTLAVVDMRSANVYAFTVQSDGSLESKKARWTLRTEQGKNHCGADGMTVDSAGRIYVATQVGLQVLDPAGPVIGVIDKPQNAWLSNVCFGGPDLDTLYVTSSNRVYKHQVNAKGVRYYDTAASNPAGGR